MAYVKKGFHEVGSEVHSTASVLGPSVCALPRAYVFQCHCQVFVEIRKKKFPAVVEKMPFVPNRYHHIK